MYDRIIELVKSTKAIVFDKKLQEDIKMKGAADFVTAVDTGISNYLKEELGKITAGYGFFSEEEDGSLSDPCWILDPIDGTTNLVYGYGLSSVSLALYSGGEIVFGVVYNPYTDECFTSVKGEGAYYNGERIHVSSRPFSESIIEFGAGSTKKHLADENFELGKIIFKQVVDLRRICSSALSVCYIAQGRIDGYFEKVLKPWDIAAGYLILQEAGGCMTDYDGNDINFAEPTSGIVGNPEVQAKLRVIIRDFYDGKRG